MKKIEKISFIGLGGVGCAYASRLYDMNPDCIRIIADKERVKRYKENKFIINGKTYDFEYIDPEQKCEPADLIIVSVKTYSLNQAVMDIKNHVGRDTVILSLLNGITSEEIIGSIYGMEKVLYGLCIGIDAIHEKNIMSYSKSGKVKFGDKINKTLSENVLAVKEVFDTANIPYEIPENMHRELWWKYMVNVGINQASAVLKAQYHVFHRVDEARELMEAAMWEVIRLSEKLDINLNEQDIKRWYDVFYTLEPSGKTSMLQDIEAGKKTEIDAFAKTVCELGQKHGVATPVNRTLLNIIKTVEAMN